MQNIIIYIARPIVQISAELVNVKNRNIAIEKEVKKYFKNCFSLHVLCRYLLFSSSNFKNIRKQDVSLKNIFGMYL